MGSTVSVGKVERTWRNSMTLIGHRLTTLHNIMIHHEFSVRGCAYQSMFIQFFITIIIQIQTNKYASSTIICGYPVQLYSPLLILIIWQFPPKDPAKRSPLQLGPGALSSSRINSNNGSVDLEKHKEQV
jgi:hypothetical protein